ncbi:MAG: Holliday junction branch migration protein RuvA [Actinomycetota bacterium]|nr:Holliday junction branch migration protein RuvA [Actinomycetota bacterium]
MIGSLRGELLDRSEAELIVEVSGIGYRVSVTPATVNEVGEVGSQVFLQIHHHRREDAETLFGFTSIDERRVFETLIGTHGVGPSLGLAILSVHSPLGLRHVLATDDVAGLCLVPGVGKKTAARLLVELKSRLAVPDGDAVSAAMAVVGGTGAPSVRSDVRDALSGLGYGPDEIGRVLSELPESGDTSDLLRLALQKLATAS